MSQETKANELNELMEQARSFVSHTLELAGFDVDVDAELDGDGVLINLTGHDAELLVTGTNGAPSAIVIDALTALAKRVAFAATEDTAALTVDAAGFRGERVELMASLADTVADKVAQGMEVDIFGMNSVDRKAVHRQLGARDEVVTTSVGFGPFRRLTVRGREA